MGEKLHIGDFGRFIFTLTKKCYGKIIRIPCDIEGAEVTDIDRSAIFLKGTDGAVYIPTKENVKSFERMNHNQKP